jgi:hypothetical protein
MTERITDAVRVLVLLAALVGLTIVALPSEPAAATEPLPPGAYVVGVEDRTVAVWVPAVGPAVVTADDDVEVELSHDADGQLLSAFSVRLGSEVFDVAIDTSREGLYLTAIAPRGMPEQQVVVVQAATDADDEDEDEDTGQDEGTPLMVQGDNPMADRVNGVAEAIKRGSDGVAGAARSLTDAVRGGGGQPATPATPATRDEDGTVTPATPATPATGNGGDNGNAGNDEGRGNGNGAGNAGNAEGRGNGAGNAEGRGNGNGRDR